MYNKKISISLVASFLLATNSLSNELYISSATKSEQSIKDVTSNVEVITKEDIEERNFSTVVEALNTLPGISFTSNGGLGKASSVKIRGFDSKRVLVLIDGVRYNDFTSTSGAPFENILIDNVERIEVIKGAQSGIWGADASAGVINIITSKVDEGLKSKLNLEYGSFNTKKYGLTSSYSNEEFYIKGFYNKLDTDGFTAYATRGLDIDSFEDDGYKNEYYGIDTGINIDDNNKISFSHSISKNENEFDNFNSDSLTNSSTGKYKFSKISYENINTLAKTKVYYNRSDFHREFPSFFSMYEGNVDEIGIKSNLNYLNDTSFMVIGTDFKKFEQNDTVINNYENNGIFITNSNRFGQTVFTQSLRYDKHDSFDNKTTGKIGVKHNFSDSLYLSSNYGTAFNTPTLGQMYGQFGANPNLNPETTKSFDISVGYSDFNLTYYNNKVTNMIDWDNGGYKNLYGESKFKGYEISYKKDIISNTLLSLNYTRLTSQNNLGEDLARRAKDDLKFALDYYGLKDFHINVNGEYIGNRKDTDGTQTGKYTVWNSVVNYKINSKLTTYLKIDNLFNKYYQTVNNYATSPRAFYAGLKATF
jgi:vitamin B12 transporter